LTSYEKERKDDAKLRKILPVNQKKLELISDPSRKISRIDRLIIQFVVKGIHPLSIVDQPEFQELLKGGKVNRKNVSVNKRSANDWIICSITGLDSTVIVMSRQTLARRIDDRFKEMTKNITERLKKANHLCITADAWTCGGKTRSFMGVTIHSVS
jgi:hypothetical protein